MTLKPVNAKHCTHLLLPTSANLPAAGAAPPRLPGSCAHPHLLPLPPAAEVPGWWRRRYLAPQSSPALDSACCCCPPTADPGSFPKASLLPPGPSLGCLRRRRAWHSAKKGHGNNGKQSSIHAHFFSPLFFIPRQNKRPKRQIIVKKKHIHKEEAFQGVTS